MILQGGPGLREGWRGGVSKSKRREGSGSDLDGRESDEGGGKTGRRGGTKEEGHLPSERHGGFRTRLQTRRLMCLILISVSVSVPLPAPDLEHM
jgi:hypothetical protein